jgi:hypothetical protein
MKGVQSIAQQGLNTFVPLFSKQDTDALGNPLSVRPDRFALPQDTNPFANASPFITNPFNVPGLGGS